MGFDAPKKKPDFEVSDLDGSTKHYDGTVGTSPVAIPTVADKIISEFFVENPITNTPVTKELSYSCDGGTTYTALRLGESMIWAPKGRIKQLYIKANAASTSYKMIVNYEDL